MKLKSLLALPLALTPALMMAGTAATPSPASSGQAYVGVSVGPTVFLNKNNYNNDGDTSYGKAGVKGGLLAGYAYHFANRFNLAGEVFGQLSSAKTIDKNDFSNGGYSVTEKASYGLRVLPGFQLTPSADIHALFGVVSGRFYSKWSPDNKTTNRTGFQAGLGSGLKICKHLSLRGDVTYTSYSKQSINLGAGSNFKSQFGSLDAMISVLYSFG
jgi:opacity protein-like surface antigen